MVKGRRKPICLIVDGHSAQRAKVMKKCLEKNERHLRISVLPGYSPRLDSDELAWNDFENHTICRTTFRAVAQLRKLVREHLEWMDDARALIRLLFEEPSARYAKARLHQAEF